LDEEDELPDQVVWRFSPASPRRQFAKGWPGALVLSASGSSVANLSANRVHQKKHPEQFRISCICSALLKKCHPERSEGSAFVLCKSRSFASLSLRLRMGFGNVSNYDGSWTEWGNLVGVPVERGAGGTAKAA
jgi:hypothetical protein